MVAKTIIIKELKRLEELYRDILHGTDADLPKYYSKLALLEFCGWIEETMDDLIIKYSNRKKIKDDRYIKRFLKQNNSFDYNNNFREIIIKIIGIIKMEKIENKVDQDTKIRFESSLKILRTMRNDHAHTMLSGAGASKMLWAPSAVIVHFPRVYSGLKNYESLLRAL